MEEKLKSRRKHITQYFPGKTFPAGNTKNAKLQIQLVGLIGHGKSSLINSCLCAFKNVAYRDIAGASTGFQTVTIRMNEFDLTPNIALIDNAGAPHIDKKVVNEVNKQAGGFRKVGDRVEWNQGWLAWFKDWFAKSSTDSCIIPVIVFKASCCLAPNIMKTLIDEMDKNLGITPPVVITFTDEFDGDMKQMKEQFATLHCPHIFTVTCYNKENNKERDVEMDKTLLDFLVACTDVAEQRIKVLLRAS